MEVVAVVSCIDRRFNEYISRMYQNQDKNKEYIFYSAEAASTFGITGSLEDAVFRRGATTIEVLCHGDCAAMDTVSRTLAGEFNDLIDNEFVRRFEDDIIKKGRLIMMNRNGKKSRESLTYMLIRNHVEEKNPAVQEANLLSIFKDTVGLKVSTKMIHEKDFKDDGITPKDSVNIVVTNATTDLPGAICASAGTNPNTTFIIRVAYLSEVAERIEFAVKKVNQLINKGVIADIRDIRFVDSKIPVSYITSEAQARNVKQDPLQNEMWSERAHMIISSKQLRFLDGWKLSRFVNGREATSVSSAGDGIIYPAAALRSGAQVPNAPKTTAKVAATR
jgi:carbonic anhydrase